MKHKKRWITGIIVIAVIILLFVGYNLYRYPAMFRSLSDNSLNDSQVEKLREEILSQPDVNVLVAYFSYSGTTKNVAAVLSEKTDGDLFEITPRDGYSNVYMESNSEIRSNERPALTDTVENMDDYDIVFVGYPVWWHATPAPVNTFLESYDLAGKLIIPFCTSGGSEIGETMPTFLNSCEGLAVYGERRISGTGQIDGWISELGLAQQEAEMRKSILFILCILALVPLALGGCAGNGNASILTEELSAIDADGAKTAAASVPEMKNMQISEALTYEYETKELYARRDGTRFTG